MRRRPMSQLLNDPPLTVREETDTATPRTPIPIYYIHSPDTPFCDNALCLCQAGRKHAQGTLAAMTEGMYTLHDAGELLNGIPVLCHCYGHSWEQTENPDVKECELCHIRGYCPGCTPVPPAQDVRPFLCTKHSQGRVSA